MEDHTTPEYNNELGHGMPILQTPLTSLLTPFPSKVPVLDLPQLYLKPSASSLLHVLDRLTRSASSFSGENDPTAATASWIDPRGLTRYLTSIISSPLAWIGDESAREQIWAAASARISERSGRSAMPTMLRKFDISTGVKIILREPSLTEDNLGLKTWTSSLLLARRLGLLMDYLPSQDLRVLELGAGTGLVGIAAACIWGADVTLTDLPDIVPNLQHNVDQNKELVHSFKGKTSVMCLDWSDAANTPKSHHQRYPLILAADPLYSPTHPRLLTETVERWLLRTHNAKFIVELPLREGYDQERANLRANLSEAGLQVEAEGTDSGYDDWEGKDGQLKEVTCWWAVWKFAQAVAATG